MIETGFLFEPEEADRLEQAECAHAIDIGGVLGRFEGNRDMGLRAEVVDFVGLDLADEAGEVRGIGEVAVVEAEVRISHLMMLVDVIHSLRVEGGCSTLNAMDFVAFFEEELSEVGSVLAGDAGDECFFIFGK